MTVRGVTICAMFKVQEFARIIFVDDIHNHATKLEDHEPLKERPSYESLDYPRTVSVINTMAWSVELWSMITIQILFTVFQMLNYPFDNDCLTPGSYCVPHLQQKLSMNHENLRNVSAKFISLSNQVVIVQKRRHIYLGKIWRPKKYSKINTAQILKFHSFS